METSDRIFKFEYYSYHTFRYPYTLPPRTYSISHPQELQRTERALFSKKPAKPYASSSRYREKFRKILYYTNNNLLLGDYTVARDIFILTRTNVIGGGLYTT